MIFRKGALDKEVGDADFYYFNGVGYTGIYNYNFDLYKVMEEDFYPQTIFYFLNVSKCNYLNDRDHLNEIYVKVQTIPNYNGKPLEHGMKSNEELLRECIERNNLTREHLLPKEKYFKLLNILETFVKGLIFQLLMF